jgi:Na+-translocating ferredoxin:NAD+ oxidoreductase RnfC subunit
MACPACGCDAAAGAPAHALQAALRDDDLDAAIALGLLDAIGCGDCSTACRAALQAARDARLRALAARERFRARNARLARRQRERTERRGSTTPAPDPIANPTTSALPPAAAAALARAKAKAAGSGGR